LGDILALATEHSDIAALLQAGEETAAAEGKPLRLMAVWPRSALRDDPGALVERLFALAKEARAELTVYYHDDAAEVAVRCAQRYGAARMVMEVPSESCGGGIVAAMRCACPGIPIQFAGDNGTLGGYPSMMELARAVCVSA